MKDGIARERDYAVRRMQSKTGGFRSPDNLITFRPFNEMSAWSGISGASMNEGVPTTGLQPTGQIRTPNDFSKRLPVPAENAQPLDRLTRKPEAKV